jgi:hypothetical protein
MKTKRQIALVAISFCIAFMVSPALRAQDNNSTDLARRLEEMETEIERLRGEISKLKQQNASVPAPPTPASQPTTNAASATSGGGSAPGPQQAAPAQNVATETKHEPASAPSNPLSAILGSTSLSGFVDGYYGYNFNEPHSRNSGLRAFDGPSNQFALNMIEVVLDKPPEATNSRLGYHLAFGFGQAMDVVNSTDPSGLSYAQYLKEAYFSYLAPVGKGLQFDFGKFVTPHGAEVIETKDNWNYSRGLLFTYAIPFYHFGLRSKYTFNDKYSLAAYVVNGWNNIVDNNTGKTLGLSFGWNPTKKIGLVQNYMVGPEQTGTNANWRQLSDTVLTYSPTARLSLMANYDYGRGDRMPGVLHPVFWTGVAGYVRYAFNEKYALAARYEYFDDHDGFTTGTAQHLNEFTQTLERRVARHLITRLEFRRDMSNRPAFVRGSAPVDAQDTLTAGLVYVFDTRESQ